MRYAYFFVLVLLSGCITVPETGRSALALLPEANLAQAASASFGDMKRSTRVSTDRGLQRKVQLIGKRIVESARNRGSTLPPPETWEFVVFEDSAANAFAMPGGKVGFYTGILNLFSSDDELAVVMGHEVAHVAARHGNERLSNQTLIGLGGIALSVATQDRSSDDRRALRTLAFKGDPNFCYGTDSAPHDVSAKECCGCAAGPIGGGPLPSQPRRALHPSARPTRCIGHGVRQLRSYQLHPIEACKRFIRFG